MILYRCHTSSSNSIICRSASRSIGDTTGEGPAWEYNYGIIPNGQIHIIAPLTYDAPAGGPVANGLGDTELGFKCRFIDEDKKARGR